MDIFDEPTLIAWFADERRPPATLCALDLRAHRSTLAGVHLAECVLMGCELDASQEVQAREQGAIVVPVLPKLPFEPFRSSPYRISDLYRGFVPGEPDARKRTFDYQNYRWFMDEATQLPKSLSVADRMYARLHDTALESALARFIDGTGRRVVGVMGGHDTARDLPVFRTVTGIARSLCRRGFLVVSGGGPGLMEAANLGAFLAPFEDASLDRALEVLAAVPKFTEVDAWLATACKVREELLGRWDADEGSESFNLGIPTWLYGHEPPNLFATHSAKLFYNSLREDGLVTIAGAGLIFGRGNAGTVQEIFQDATQNYYRSPGVSPTPMALLEKSFWIRSASQGPDPVERTKPLEPLLMALAKEKPKTDWSSAVLLTDDPDEVIALIEGKKTADDVGALTRGELWASNLSAIGTPRAS